MSVYLKAKDGLIEIYTEDSLIDGEPVFVTASVYEAARYLYDYKITDWSNPADKDGWPTKNAADEVMTQLAYIHHRELNRRSR